MGQMASHRILAEISTNFLFGAAITYHLALPVAFLLIHLAKIFLEI